MLRNPCGHPETDLIEEYIGTLLGLSLEVNVNQTIGVKQVEKTSFYNTCELNIFA
jgi:hypothetical protein